MKPQSLQKSRRTWIALMAGAITLAVASPMNAADAAKKSKTQLATLGGGCFWCVEAVFEPVPGVKNVVSGYAGGKTENPDYKSICTGMTGHAEVVQIEFDPEKITYEKILDLFWKAHNPTTLNRQGADAGTQYRSVIMYHDETQKAAAEKSKKAAGAKFDDPIVTEIVAAPKFYAAEEYHQDYFKKNPNAGYCTFVIRPKLDKLKPEDFK